MTTTVNRPDVMRILSAAALRGAIPQAECRRFPPEQLGDLDLMHDSEVDQDSRTVRVRLWTSTEQRKTAIGYFNAVAPHMPEGWVLRVVAECGSPGVVYSDEEGSGFSGPPEPIPALARRTMMPTTRCVPSREEAETALATYHEDGGEPAELTGRYVLVNRLDSQEPPIVLYEMKDTDDTAWLDPAGFNAGISLTEYFETS
ncbi:hypothetical protein [Nonomuraea sp. NPDC005650]|uniref:hypothetical protein n=1 Tax=Nonomuraea sp. NPDC005650 TaxID=3157045 RepID=UPI0033A15CED